MSVPKEELQSLIKAAVQEGLQGQPVEYDCPDCHAKFDRVPAYLDHRVSEYVEKSLEGVKAQIGELKIPTSDEFLQECKGGLCAIIEETYDVRKKGEVAESDDEPSGLFNYPRDDEEQEPG